MTTQDELVALSAGELEQVTGGEGFHPLGFLNGPYHNIVFGIASEKGGTMLADKMYGPHVTQADRARAQAAMREFLAGGGKLPKGVPNLFG